MIMSNTVYHIINEHEFLFYYGPEEFKEMKLTKFSPYSCGDIIKIIRMFGYNNIQIFSRIMRALTFITITDNLLRFLSKIENKLIIKIIMKILLLRKDKLKFNNFYEILEERYFNKREEFDIYQMIIYDIDFRTNII
jgi:hypothetical protein